MSRASVVIRYGSILEANECKCWRWVPAVPAEAAAIGRWRAGAGTAPTSGAGLGLLPLPTGAHLRSAAATAERAGLIAPHGGKLVNLMVPEDQKAAVKASATKTMDLSDRNACDVELLCVG